MRCLKYEHVVHQVFLVALGMLKSPCRDVLSYLMKIIIRGVVANRDNIQFVGLAADGVALEGARFMMIIFFSK